MYTFNERQAVFFLLLSVLLVSGVCVRVRSPPPPSDYSPILWMPSRCPRIQRSPPIVYLELVLTPQIEDQVSAACSRPLTASLMPMLPASPYFSSEFWGTRARSGDRVPMQANGSQLPKS